MAKKKTHEEYVAEVAVKNPEVEVAGRYVGANEKILHKCLKDNCRYEWSATPHNILAGKGCPKCAGKMKRTHNEYVEKINLIHNNIEVVEKYIDNNTPILHRCVLHNFEWSAFPNNVLSGHGCRKCANDKMHYAHRFYFLGSLKNIIPLIAISVSNNKTTFGYQISVRFPCVESVQ